MEHNDALATVTSETVSDWHPISHVVEWTRNIPLIQVSSQLWLKLNQLAYLLCIMSRYSVSR